MENGSINSVFDHLGSNGCKCWNYPLLLNSFLFLNFFISENVEEFGSISRVSPDFFFLAFCMVVELLKEFLAIYAPICTANHHGIKTSNCWFMINKILVLQEKIYIF